MTEQEETIEVDREKLRQLQKHAEYAHGKFTKDLSYPDPTQRVGHIAKQLEVLLEGEENTMWELEEYEYRR